MANAQPTDYEGTISLKKAIIARMAGPGYFYNLGNLVGLASGMGFALIGAQVSGSSGSGGDAIVHYLVGSPGAAALTLAMIIFFASGEFYHRAKTAEASCAIERHLRAADFLSGIAALLLAVALVSFGDYLLALVSTLLLAGGKFGNALLRPGVGLARFEYLGLSGRTRNLRIDLFRAAVLVSRLPAMAGLLIALVASSADPVFLRDGPSAILLFCYCLWMYADLLLAKT